MRHEALQNEFAPDGPEYDGGYDRPCERCGEDTHCEEIPMMGYSEFLCRKCAAAAYRMEEVV